MHDLWARIAHTASARCYSLIVAVVSLAIVARVLGPSGQGQVAAITSWVGLLSTLGTLSLGQVTLHRAGALRGQNWLGPTTGSLLVIAIAITALGAAITIFLGHRVLGPSASAPVLIGAGLCLLPGLVWEQYGSALLNATGQLRIYNNAQLAARTATLVLLVVALPLHYGPVTVLLTMAAGQAIVGFAGIGSLIRLAGAAIRPDWPTVRQLLTGGARLHANAVGAFLVSSINVLILNQAIGPEQAGYFQLAFQLASVVLVLPQAATLVLFGRIAAKDPDEIWQEQRVVLFWATIMVLVAAISGMVLGPLIIPRLLGAAFKPAVWPFQALMLGLIFMTFSTVMGVQWIARGWFVRASMITVAVGATNVAASLILVPRYGLKGAVAGTLIAQALSLCPNAFLAVLCERRLHRTLALHHALAPTESR